MLPPPDPCYYCRPKTPLPDIRLPLHGIRYYFSTDATIVRIMLPLFDHRIGNLSKRFISMSVYTLGVEKAFNRHELGNI